MCGGDALRIGVNCFLLRANVGGMKQYFFSLARELLETDRQNEYVFFHFPHNAGELAALENRHWQANAVLLHSQWGVLPHLGKIDLYFCPLGVLWPRPLPVPTVVTMHDIQEVFYPQFFSELDLYYRAWQYPGSSHMADHVIAISHFSKETIVKHHRISPAKVTVAHLCADERFYRAADVARLPQAPLPEDDFIFYPANHWQHKNHDALLQAMQWLKTERGLRISAVFTGYDVPNSYPLAQKAADYGLTEQVYFAGYVAVEEMVYLYTKAKMLVFPSLFEGFGIPLIEAMAAGCPVVAANASSLPEIGGEAAEYFDPSSPESIGLAIEKVWCDGKLRHGMIERGRRHALDFSAAKLAQTHLAVFDEAVRSFSPVRYAWNLWIYQHYLGIPVHFKYRKVLIKWMLLHSRQMLWRPRAL
jgi:glycosyltransferase involved in cell wall biosynthesis